MFMGAFHESSPARISVITGHIVRPDKMPPIPQVKAPSRFIVNTYAPSYPTSDKLQASSISGEYLGLEYKDALSRSLPLDFGSNVLLLPIKLFTHLRRKVTGSVHGEWGPAYPTRHGESTILLP